MLFEANGRMRGGIPFRLLKTSAEEAVEPQRHNPGGRKHYSLDNIKNEGLVNLLPHTIIHNLQVPVRDWLMAQVDIPQAVMNRLKGLDTSDYTFQYRLYRKRVITISASRIRLHSYRSMRGSHSVFLLADIVSIDGKLYAKRGVILDPYRILSLKDIFHQRIEEIRRSKYAKSPGVGTEQPGPGRGEQVRPGGLPKRSIWNIWR